MQRAAACGRWPAPCKASAAMSSLPPSRSKRVLLVDGDFRSSQRLADLLREDGFEVDVARDGSRALASLARAPAPDVLITELTVPRADGATIARFALTQRPTLQIVVLTRYPNWAISAAFGVTPPTVLSKPLDYGYLLALLQSGSARGVSVASRCASPRS
jgi:CheY-like chemotaxis protein